MEPIMRRDRLATADSRVRALLADAARSLWGLGQVCLEVQRDELYRDGGHADLYTWAETQHGISRNTADKAMAVAEHFGADMAERFGTEKLAATVRYLEATRKVEQAGDALSLTFRVQRGGRFATVPFERATYRDIDEARQLVLKSRAEKPEPLARETVARAEALAAALPPPPRGAGRGERVRVERAGDGRPMFSFRAIPEDELPAFVEALRAHLLP